MLFRWRERPASYACAYMSSSTLLMNLSIGAGLHHNRHSGPPRNLLYIQWYQGILTLARGRLLMSIDWIPGEGRVKQLSVNEHSCEVEIMLKNINCVEV